MVAKASLTVIFISSTLDRQKLVCWQENEESVSGSGEFRLALHAKTR